MDKRENYSDSGAKNLENNQDIDTNSTIGTNENGEILDNSSEQETIYNKVNNNDDYNKSQSLDPREIKKDENEISSDTSLQPTLNDEDGKHKKNSTKKTILELTLYVAVLLMCVFVVPKYVVQRTVVDGPSMENTLHSGENLIVDKITYRLSEPKRFDIVMFYPFGRAEKEYYVKRIIGLPGETIQIIGSDIYINNKKLVENYGKEPITDPGIAADPITLADDEYFVLGDNREVSEDSRFTVGPVKKDLIEGKCLIRIWPLNKFGTVR